MKEIPTVPIHYLAKPQPRVSLLPQMICHLVFHLIVQRSACKLETILTQLQNLLHSQDYRVNVTHFNLPRFRKSSFNVT